MIAQSPYGFSSLPSSDAVLTPTHSTQLCGTGKRPLWLDMPASLIFGNLAQLGKQYMMMGCLSLTHPSSRSLSLPHSLQS